VMGELGGESEGFGAKLAVDEGGEADEGGEFGGSTRRKAVAAVLIQLLSIIRNGTRIPRTTSPTVRRGSAEKRCGRGGGPEETY
jgi:hypothetical protein